MFKGCGSPEVKQYKLENYLYFSYEIQSTRR